GLPGGTDAFAAVYAVRRRVRRRRGARAAVGGCLVTGLVAAAVLVGSGVTPGTPGRLATPALGPAYRLTGALVSFDGCGDYLDYMRARATAEVGPYGLSPYGAKPYGGNGILSNAPAFLGPAGGAGAGGIAAGGAARAPAGSPPVTAFSQTDDQVPGVDEPDTVKTDGAKVVTLQGSTLYVLDTSARVLGSLQLPGDAGGGLLLDGDRAVVLSSGGAGQAAGEGLVPAPSLPYPGAPMARATVVDLSDAAHPRLVRTFVFDGVIVSARLVGGQIRLVDRSDGPRLSFVDPSSTGDASAATGANRKLIAASTLADWLPGYQVASPDGARSARQPISSCAAVARPAQASGISTVSVVDLDPHGDTLGPGTSVVAAGAIVYATASHLYVAGQAPPAGGGAIPFGCCGTVAPTGSSTAIYAFDTPPAGPPVFTGAGSVPGWLVTSYAMDEGPGGLLRVASTEMSPTRTTDAQVTILRLSGDKLVAVGTVAGLGNGEAIKAVRFIGQYAYVVTYRSFDPLYVVDLRDPARPAVAGQLDQPGFSEFLYPLPGGRLIGVGVQITANEPSGLVVATYDVSDPAQPSRISSSSLAGGQYAYQGYDPHAFLYWPPSDLALLALPGGAYQGGAGVAAYTIGAGGQLTRAATLGHGSAVATRSAVIGAQVWVVTATGIVTASLSDLATTAWHPF
ncbi:MAG: beta-propeller domain-containing protein, partial [Acidimicrobiales bacterium]